MVTYLGLVLGASVTLLSRDQKGAGKRECVLMEPGSVQFRNTFKGSSKKGLCGGWEWGVFRESSVDEGTCRQA